MGKQTNKSGSHFGGEWTIQKLHIIEEYLKAYATVLKNQKIKKIYVDGFAGSGTTELKHDNRKNRDNNTYIQQSMLDESNNSTSSKTVQGSALLSLKYDFDEYYFVELDQNRISDLKNAIKLQFPQKYSKVHFIAGDSNVKILEIVSKITVYDRCLMFLDPYALELNWKTLEAISKCCVVDLWYLFPLSLIRLIEKQRKISESNKHIVSSILGTEEWLDELFVKSEQINIFDEDNDDIYGRIDYESILDYIKSRFATIFPYVSPETKILRNEEKNSPMFMLCFMMTNTSQRAQQLASTLVKSIIKSTEKV